MKSTKNIIIGADPFGYDIKEAVKAHLVRRGYTVKDISEDGPIDYYLVGSQVGKAVSEKEYPRGMVFCGSGMGVNIVANKYPGVYCGLVESIFTAQLCRTINNCNVLSLGGFLNAPTKACKMADAFLDVEFASSGDEVDPDFLRMSFDKIQEMEKEIYITYGKKFAQSVPNE